MEYINEMGGGGKNYGFYREVITSAPTFKAASKKAKLLEIGYRICRSDMIDCWRY